MRDLATLDNWLATREAAVPNLRDGCAKQVVWAGQTAVQTDLSVVFLHGFSASSGELRPLPDLVASDFGANLYFQRLTGHGQDGAAMAKATLDDWIADTQEALVIAAALGRQTLVIGCSTGCTLATLALSKGAQIKGLVQISPNYGLAHKAAQAVLDAPYAQHWGHLVAGKTRHFDPISPAHAQFWTTTYPSIAAFPMGEAVRAVKAAPLEDITTPTMFAFNDADQVVCARTIRGIMGRWGGPVTHLDLEQGPDDDAMGHVMAGDVFSPRQTAPLARRIVDWARSL